MSEINVNINKAPEEVKEVPKNEKKNDKASFELEEHFAFEGDMKTNLLSSAEMSNKINAMFGAVFSDFVGCRVRINTGASTPGVSPIVLETIPVGSIYVDLYFKDNGPCKDDRFKSIKLRGAANSNKGNDNEESRSKQYFAVAARIAPTATGRIYDVTKETYDILEEFMNYRNIRWAAYTQEIAEPMNVYGGKEEAVVCITALNLDKILAKMYGDKTENGRVEYMAIPTTPIPTSSGEFILQVSQLNTAVVNKLQSELGIGTAAAVNYHKYNL